MQNVSAVALIQLPGDWLWNTMMEGGDRDSEEGAGLEMESWDLGRGSGAA